MGCSLQCSGSRPVQLPLLDVRPDQFILFILLTLLNIRYEGPCSMAALPLPCKMGNKADPVLVHCNRRHTRKDGQLMVSNLSCGEVRQLYGQPTLERRFVQKHGESYGEQQHASIPSVPFMTPSVLSCIFRIPAIGTLGMLLYACCLFSRLVETCKCTRVRVPESGASRIDRTKHCSSRMASTLIMPFVAVMVVSIFMGK